VPPRAPWLPVVLTAFSSLSPAYAAPKPRDAAQAVVAELDRQKATGAGVPEALAEVRRSLVRADRARLAGDHRHGAELEELALEWAEAARARARLAAAAAQANALERKVIDSDATLERARALIEQTIAQRARSEAELAELERQRSQPAPPPAPARKPGAKAKAQEE